MAGDRYPSVEAFLASRGGHATVYPVLHEDGYETLFGDGEFHYLWNVFQTRDAAQADIERNRIECVGAYREWGRFHVRELSLSLVEGRAAIPAFKPEYYDEYDAEMVLTLLERRLRWGLLSTNNSPDWMVAWDALWLVKFSSGPYVYCYSDESVEALLAGNEGDVGVHWVEQIKAGAPGPAISRKEWAAGRR